MLFFPLVRFPRVFHYNLFSEYGRFIFVENNKDDIKEVLKKICELRENVSNEPVIDFSAKNVAQKLVEIRRIQK